MFFLFYLLYRKIHQVKDYMCIISSTIRIAANAYVTRFVHNGQKVASTVSISAPSISSRQAIVKNVMMGHPQWQLCMQRSLKVCHQSGQVVSSS